MHWLRSSLLWPTVLAPTALLLGYVGYRSLSELELTRIDALFRSLQLFVLDSSVQPDRVPWTLELARFLAPLSVVFATVLALAAILRDQYHRLRIALTARDHVVLIGLGRASAQVARTLTEQRRKVVVVEADAANPRLNGVRATGALTVLGDAMQEPILLRARVKRARQVLVTTGDDSLNLEVAGHIRRLHHEHPSSRLVVHVAVDELGLWGEIGRLHVGRLRDGLTLEFHNQVDQAAQLLIEEAERTCGGDGLRRVFIEGDGELAQRVVVRLLHRGLFDAARTTVQLSADTSFPLDQLLQREPWVRTSADITPRVPAPRDPDIVVLVCLSDEAAPVVGRALQLSRAAPGSPVFAAVRGQHSDALLGMVGLEDVHLVNVGAERAFEDFEDRTGLEVLARARHEDYVANERERGRTAAKNPSMAPWHELPDSLKESNRRFAEAVGEVVDSLGGWLVPLRSLDQLEPALTSGDTLERLARDEHDRWVRDLVRDGWSHAPAPKDPERKTHPLLVPWEDLDEAEREKDRDAIRAIPRMLARVGYAVDLPRAAR